MKEEKSKKGVNKRTPEMVRDTPRRSTLRSGNNKETEEESDEDTDSADEGEEEENRERSPTLERNMMKLEEKTRKIELKGEDSSMVDANSMETEPPAEWRDDDCVVCGV